MAEDYFSEKESEEQRPEVTLEEGENVTSPPLPPLDSSPVPNTERRTLSELVTGTGDLDSIDPPNISSPSQTQSSLPNQQQPVSYFGTRGFRYNKSSLFQTDLVCIDNRERRGLPVYTISMVVLLSMFCTNLHVLLLSSILSTKLIKCLCTMMKFYPIN